jgi:hypothetical protein
VLAQALPMMGLNQNLMGSADCEPTLRLVSDCSLPALLTAVPAPPGWGRFLHAAGEINQYRGFHFLINYTRAWYAGAYSQCADHA